MTTSRRGRPLERSSLDDPPSSFRKAVSYIDTIQLVLSRHFSKERFDKYWQSLWGPSIELDGRYRCKKTVTTNGFWIYKVVLHQPTSSELYALSEIERLGGCRVTRVDVALDLIAHDSCSPDALRRHVESRLIPSMRAKRTVIAQHDGHEMESVTCFENTTYYFRGRRCGIEIALYSDRFSKTGYGWQCCHLEYRVMGAKRLRTAGVSTVKDVYALNHTKFWDSHLAFWRPPTPDSLARSSNGTPSARTVDSLGTQTNQRQAHSIFRLATHHEQGMLNATRLYFELRDRTGKYNRRPLRLFERVDHTWALPEPRNYLWPSRNRLTEPLLG